MLLYTMLYIVLAYLMLFAALSNSVCLNNASFFFLFKYFLCQGYELSGEIALKNNHYYYYIRCDGYKACTKVSFRHDITTTLKSVSSMAGKGCITGVLKGRNHCRRSLNIWPVDVAN